MFITQKIKNKIIIVFVSIRFLATLTMTLLNLYVINAYDTFNYWNGAKDLKNIYYNNKTILHNIIYDSYKLKYYKYPYELEVFTNNYYFNNHDVYGIRTIFLYTPLAFLGIENYILANIIVSSIIIIWIVYIIKLLYNKVGLLAFVPFLEPNSLLWTSAISKEIFLYPAFWYIITITIFYKKYNFGNLILTILSLLLILYIRPLLLIILIFLIILTYITKINNKKIQLGLLAIIILIPIIFWEKFQVLLHQARWEYYYQYFITEAKQLPFLGEYEINPTELISILPVVLYNAFIAPAFYFSSSIIWNASALYNTLLVIILIYISVKNKITFNKIFLVFIITALLTGIYVGLSVANLGTMLRYKIFHFSLFLFGFLGLYYKANSK